MAEDWASAEGGGGCGPQTLAQQIPGRGYLLSTGPGARDWGSQVKNTEGVHVGWDPSSGPAVAMGQSLVLLKARCWQRKPTAC